MPVLQCQHWEGWHQMMKRIWKNRNSFLAVGMKSGTGTLEDILLISYKSKHTLITLTYSKKLKTYVQTKTSTWLFIAVLFTRVKIGKQPICSLEDEWVNMVISRRKGTEARENRVMAGGINGDWRRFEFGWWTHNTMYRWCIIEFYT